MKMGIKVIGALVVALFVMGASSSQGPGKSPATTAAKLAVQPGARLVLPQPMQVAIVQAPKEPGFRERLWNDPTAMFSCMLALLTAGLVVASVAQGWMILIQIRLARDEFNATHRPKLVVKNVYLDNDGAHYSICFGLANIGDAPATIVNNGATFAFFTDEASFRQATLVTLDPNTNLTLATGKERAAFLPVKADVVYRAQHPHGLDGGGDNFLDQMRMGNPYFFGVIQYTDAVGNERNCVFRRAWRGGEFVRTGNPDHEYSD